MAGDPDRDASGSSSGRIASSGCPGCRTAIAGVSVESLAARFGTPLYVYDASVIRQRIKELRQFDVIRYAQKANSNLSILRRMRSEGLLVDAVSAGEVWRALRAGYTAAGDPPPIVFTADVFDQASLELCVESGIHVNAGSIDMIHQLGQALPGRELTLRVNPGFGHGHSQKTNTGGTNSKHGIWHHRLDECMVAARRYGMRVTGLHMHIGSGADMPHLVRVCDAMRAAFRIVGSTVRTISAGGGLPIPEHEGEARLDVPAYFRCWDKTRQQIEAEVGQPVRLEIEPGRYLVAESGFLISEIRATKRVGDKLFYLVDAGFNNMARSVLYGAYHPISIAHTSAQANLTEQVEVVVGGPLCESGDIFTQQSGGLVTSRTLPEANVGDYLLIECVGAYGFSMSSNYNSQPLAAEVMITDECPQLIRRRQSLDDLLANEV